MEEDNETYESQTEHERRTHSVGQILAQRESQLELEDNHFKTETNQKNNFKPHYLKTRLDPNMIVVERQGINYDGTPGGILIGYTRSESLWSRILRLFRL